MTRTERYAREAAIAKEGCIRGTIAEVTDTLKALYGDGKFRHLSARYTTGEKEGQSYGDGWHLHDATSFPEATSREEAIAKEAKMREQRERTGTIALASTHRPGVWRTPKVAAIHTVQLFTAPGVAVTVPVIAYRP